MYKCITLINYPRVMLFLVSGKSCSVYTAAVKLALGILENANYLLGFLCFIEGFISCGGIHSREIRVSQGYGVHCTLRHGYMISLKLILMFWIHIHPPDLTLLLLNYLCFH